MRLLATMRKVRVAVIGCGGIAQLVHIPSLKRLEGEGLVELVAVCDLYEEVARAVASKFGVERWRTSHVELLEREDVDAVVNATWHAAHARVTIDAARAGKHVFVEKPMAVTIEECREMVEACRRAGVKLMVGFMKRFDPSLRWVRGLARGGSLGDVFLVNSWYYDTVVHMEYVRGLAGEFIRPRAPPPREAWAFTKDRLLSLLLTHGVHHADLLRWVGGEVRAVTASYAEGSGESYVLTAILEYEGGATGYFQLAGPVADDWDEGLVVKGTEGSARVYIRFPYFKWRSEAVAYLKGRGEYVSKLFPCRDMYLEELRHFVECVASGGEPEPSGLDGLRAQELIYAMHRSVREGRRVELSELRG